MAVMKILECVICKKQFVSSGHNARYCCEECKKKGNEITRRRRAIESKANQNNDGDLYLTNMAIEAREAGMSYGQYVAQKYAKTIKITRAW